MARMKAVEVYTISGKFVRSFATVKEAAKSFGSCEETIIKACRGGIDLLKGYELRYAGEDGKAIKAQQRAEFRAEKRRIADMLQRYRKGHELSYKRELSCKGLSPRDIYEMAECMPMAPEKWRILGRQLDKIFAI